jgi:hypothetical protein
VDRLAGEIAIGDDDEVAIPPHVAEAVEVSWGRFHKHFTSVRSSVAPMQPCFQNALVYLPTSVSYECKMFMKFPPARMG